MSSSGAATALTKEILMARAKLRPALGLLALGALAPAFATNLADAAPAGKYPPEQRLVVRGDATAVDGACDARGCVVDFADGSFRGAPLGTGAYSGSFRIRVADAFPNGEGGICAPLKGRVVLGGGTADRLVLGVAGDSCQDGGGPLPEASFTGLAQFTVKHGTGRYARATGSGQATFSEDAANQHRMTLIGRIAG
jgi:hypothetical protein